MVLFLLWQELLLHKGVTVLLNVPDIEDTRCMTDILRELGCDQ